MGPKPDDDYTQTMPECNDNPYYRECLAADSGDESSKAAHMEWLMKQDFDQ
jgi:hypothetical protein